MGAAKAVPQVMRHGERRFMRRAAEVKENSSVRGSRGASAYSWRRQSKPPEISDSIFTGANGNRQYLHNAL